MVVKIDGIWYMNLSLRAGISVVGRPSVSSHSPLEAQRTRVVVRIAAHEHVLHESLGAYDFDIHALGGKRKSDAVDLLGLPALLDAVIDKSNETGCDDDTVIISISIKYAQRCYFD